MIAHCELMGDRIAILDPPPDLNPQQVAASGGVNEAGYDSKFATLYWPWVKVLRPRHRAPTGSSRRRATWPASGRATTTRAACTRRRPTRSSAARSTLQTQITKAEHDLLNPVGINCIRSFPGRGIRVWGARTLSSDPAWRYLNVRRLFNYLEESILLGTQWVVFEPNDHALWARIRRTISAFLISEWRKGALFGTTPDEAFFVKCDDETNPAEGIDAGQVVCQIGVAPVKPAEFVIFQLSQFSGGTSLVIRIRHTKEAAHMALADPLDSSAANGFTVTIDGIQIPKVTEVSGLKTEVDKIELKQQTSDGKYVVRQLIGRAKTGRVHRHPRPDRQQDDHRLAQDGRGRAMSPAPARPHPWSCSTTRARRSRPTTSPTAGCAASRSTRSRPARPSRRRRSSWSASTKSTVS